MNKNFALATLPLLLLVSPAAGAEIKSLETFQGMPAYPKFVVDNLWILGAAVLVFIMHLGFATLESGLTRQKNTVNILFKNLFIISYL